VDWVLLLVVVGLVILLPAALYRPPAVFVVRIRHGGAVAVRGAVTAAFLAAVEEAAAGAGVGEGEVRGVRQGRRVALWFSRTLPGGFRQRLRNWWGVSGWAASPGRGL
jgi:hypothetical protein